MQRPAGSLIATSILAFALSSCGGSDGECVVDTDCDLGFRCASSRSCEPVGGGNTDAGRPDSGVRDAASPIDANAPIDAAGDVDAANDQDAGS